MSTQKKKDSKDITKKGMNRRDFIKTTVATTAAGTALDWAFVGPKALAVEPDKVVRNICPYCSIGCGLKVAVKDDKVIDIYGDETSVLNRGALCSKGSALIQLVNNEQRVTEPKIKYNNAWYVHGTSGAAGWTDILKSGIGAAGTIDLSAWKNEVTGAAGSGTIDSLPRALGKARLSNPDTVAFWGSSHMTNEECYLYRKFITAFGTNNVEHQARI